MLSACGSNPFLLPTIAFVTKSWVEAITPDWYIKTNQFSMLRMVSQNYSSSPDKLVWVSAGVNALSVWKMMGFINKKPHSVRFYHNTLKRMTSFLCFVKVPTRLNSYGTLTSFSRSTVNMTCFFRGRVDRPRGWAKNITPKESEACNFTQV